MGRASSAPQPAFVVGAGFMRTRRAAPVLSALLIALVALGGTGARRAAAQQAPGEAAAPGHITTVLHPGWNMVGWPGPATGAAELFDAIPALETALAWDASGQRYRSLSRGSAARTGLTRLTPGMGVWLRLGGDAAVEWRRPPPTEGALLPLRAGWNLVGWSGEDGAPVEAALARFGDLLVGASRWSAETRRYEHYRPGERAGASTLTELERGDALWVQLTGDALWWQSGASGVDFQFARGIAAAQRDRVRADTASVVAFFAEDYGVEPPELEVVFRPEVITWLGHSRASAWFGRIDVHTPSVDAVDAETLAHEYFHVLQFHLGDGALLDPLWLFEGAATYAADRYVRVGREGVDPEASHPGPADLEYHVSVLVRHDLPTLVEVEEPRPFYSYDSLAYSLGTLAVDWLVDHSTEGAIVDYYRRLGQRQAWEEAFEASFGIAADDFYEAFAAYRADIAPPLPHLGDESLDTVLVVGSGSAEHEAAARRLFAELQAFVERFGGGRPHLTVYIGDEASLAPVHRRLYGEEIPARFCSTGGVGFLLLTVDCPERFPLAVIAPYLRDVRDRLAPEPSLPEVAEGYDRRGPRWLHLAIEGYIHDAYRVATGHDEAAKLRETRIVMARRTTSALAEYGTAEDAESRGREWALGLGILAGEWLAERAGEAALLDYYRRLPASASWQEAFESAFGLPVEDFHDAFEHHRAGIAPPFVLHRVRGVLLDPGGAPAAGAWIAASMGEPSWEDTTHTAEDGSFDLLLRDGRHTLFVLLESTGCEIPVDAHLRAGGDVAVEGAGVTGVEIRLPEGSSCAGG